MGNKKQVDTINKRYGSQFWSDQGAIGGKIGGARPFRDVELARLAQRKSVESRLKKKAERENN